MPASAVHIAGIGLSSSTGLDINKLAISAGTKALLDAGITYAKVESSVACFLDEPHTRIARSLFKIFGRQKASVSEIDGHSALSTAVQCVSSGQTDCALLVGVDVVAAVGIVLVSERFVTSHAYLKDSAVCIRACVRTPVEDPRLAVQEALRKASLEMKDIHMVETQGTAALSEVKLELRSREESSNIADKSSAGQGPFEGSGVTGWVGLCRLGKHNFAATLKPREPDAHLQNCMQYISQPDEPGATVLILCRSDGQKAPAYASIKHLRDGRERLGYNPVEEMREIDREDLEAIGTREGDRMLVGGAEATDRTKLASRGGDRAALARL
ncbi:hypothetical protein Q7P37_009592 [Cladosporium fusiforme]